MTLKEIRDVLAEASLAKNEGDIHQAVHLAEIVEVALFGVYEVLWIAEVRRFGLFPA